MFCRSAILFALGVLAPASASADGCRLDHATYHEARSGAEIRFRPKDTAVDDTLMTGLFDLRLPNMPDAFRGNITWNAGNNARPDGAIERPCTADEDSGRCWLWSDNVFTLDGSAAGLVDDAAMAAPKALLFSNLGRSLRMTQAFVVANPDLDAFDVFTLTGCQP